MKSGRGRSRAASLQRQGRMKSGAMYCAAIKADLKVEAAVPAPARSTAPFGKLRVGPFGGLRPDKSGCARWGKTNLREKILAQPEAT